MNSKFLHKTIINFYKDKLPEMKKEFFEPQKQIDNVVVWVAGLSTGAIALLLTKYDSNFIVELVYLKITVFFFLTTIISAVFYRSVFYFIQQMSLSLINNFEGFCFGYTAESFGPMEIEDYHTINDLADSLKNDMGYDFDFMLENQSLDRNFWVDQYKKMAKIWTEHETQGFKNLAQAIAPLYGKMPNEVNETLITKHDNTSQIKKYIMLNRIAKWSYLGVMIFFLLAIMTISIGFLNI